MANTKISDIANDIELGDNRGKSATLADTGMKAGFCVYKSAGSEVKTFVSGASTAPYGILNSRWDTGLDATQVSGDAGHVVTEGYAAAFIDDPEASAYAGESVYAGANGATDGYLSLSAISDDAIPMGRLESDMSNGDNVARIKIDKGGNTSVD